MQKGYLFFDLKKHNGTCPVVNAKVKIINIDGREVNRLLNVNDDGKTNEIEIYTKDTSLTFDKSNKEIPYTKVDAEIFFEDDKIIYIDGIQVYSDVTSIQEIKFDDSENKFKTKERKGKLKKEHIHFKNEPPCIFQSDSKSGKNFYECEKEIKPIFKSQSLCVPEFITIKVVNSNNEFEIITVPFIDYIKNVACSCVYPTWGKEAIRANVYSIISFAMNRVYTDWYKSRGYGFEITNSRYHDQMYVKGRNLFKNVCDIVEDIYGTCIKISGFNQPLLCKCFNDKNDKRTLSRWGSFDLCEDGFSAIEILKKYFGENIEISEVKEIGGILKKYSGEKMVRGCRGDDVKFIQRALNFIGEKYKGIKNLKEDGEFGENSERGVLDFQRIFNLDNNGIVDMKTWNKISLIYSLGKKLFGFGNVPEELSCKNIDHKNHNHENEKDEKCSLNRVILEENQIIVPIRFGDSGENVKALQREINNLSNYYGFLPKLSEDGIYGDNTFEGVLKFQKKFSLIEDGIFGEESLKKLISLNKALQELSLNEEVLRIKYDEVVLDRKQFKSEYSMEYPNFNIEFGSICGYVTLVQKYINEIKQRENYFSSREKIKEDGKFGEETLRSVNEFQKKFNLERSSFIDERTWNKLVYEYEKNYKH